MDEVVDEASRLLGFVAPDAAEHRVRFVPQPEPPLRVSSPSASG
jgi:hypothetical protein